MQVLHSLWRPFRFSCKSNGSYDLKLPFVQRCHLLHGLFDHLEHLERLVCSVLLLYSPKLTSLSIVRTGITIDTFVLLRKKLETRLDDTREKCFICGIEKNTFNRTLDRTAFAQHIKFDQNLWNYIYFIMYVWEQDKDDDDGLETFVRKCIENNDLTWFPMNKAIRLAQHQEKGDVHSLKYRFRKDMEKTESILNSRMTDVKDQISRTIARVEKALEYEHDNDRRGRTQPKSVKGISRLNSVGVSSIGGNGGSDSKPETVRRKSITLAPLSGRDQINGKVLSPPRSPSQARQTTALDADILGQMHVRMVSITGMKIPQSFIKYTSVKIVSDYETSLVTPIVNVQSVKSLSAPSSPDGHSHKSPSNNPNKPTTSANNSVTPGPSVQVSYNSKSVERVSTNLKNSRASFVLSKKVKLDDLKEQAQTSLEGNDADSVPTIRYEDDQKLQLRFDLIANPSTLVHEGLLPNYDLSKFMIKIQVLFNVQQFYSENFNLNIVEDSSFGHSDFIYLGGANIPITTLVGKAHEGRLLEIGFSQSLFELSIPGGIHLQTNESNSFAETHGINLDHLEDHRDDHDTHTKEEENQDKHKGKKSKAPHHHSKKRKSLSKGAIILLPASESCVMTVSSVASHRLLQDWALIQKKFT